MLSIRELEMLISLPRIHVTRLLTKPQALETVVERVIPVIELVIFIGLGIIGVFWRGGVELGAVGRSDGTFIGL
jgi:hypothetical protein